MAKVGIVMREGNVYSSRSGRLQNSSGLGSMRGFGESDMNMGKFLKPVKEVGLEKSILVII